MAKVDFGHLQRMYICEANKACYILFTSFYFYFKKLLADFRQERAKVIHRRPFEKDGFTSAVTEFR